MLAGTHRHAFQVEQGIRRVTHALHNIYPLAQGGTAVGTGLNAHPEFAERFAAYAAAAGIQAIVLVPEGRISMGKLASCRAAIDICREARALLGRFLFSGEAAEAPYEATTVSTRFSR